MEKKEYLNEESYQKTKKKITKVSLIILVVGLVIGFGLILIGVVSQRNAKKTNEERYNAAYLESQARVDAANKRLDEIAKEKQDLSKQKEAKQYECDSLDMMAPNWFADKTKCQGEVRSITSKITDLEMEQFDLEHANYTVYYNEVPAIKYIIFYVLGGIVIFASLITSGSIYLVAKRREIAAFTIQQTMPLAQEGIEKMAPTIGNAAGTIGKDIAQGITSGIKEGLNNDNQK